MIPTLHEFVSSEHFLHLPVSLGQRTLLKAMDGEPLTEEERAVWEECTGRSEYPGRPYEEVTWVGGARGGKDSRLAAPLALREALFGQHEERLGAGERGTIVLVAQDQRGVRTVFNYIRDYLLILEKKSPAIAKRIHHIYKSEIHFHHNLDIVCFATTSKSMRGWSIPVAVMDELAFFRSDESADADNEIQTSIRRGQISFGDRKRLVKISTPLMRAGVLWEDYQEHFAQNSADILVWHSTTRRMNETISEETLAREQRRNPAKYRREYLAEFGTDVEAFLPHVWIAGATMDGRHELPPLEGARYVAAVDPSGGSKAGDAFALTIIHPEPRPEGTVFVQDVLKSWAGSRSETVNLTAVVAEAAGILARYGIYTVVGDKYGGEWPTQAFQQHAVLYRASELNKAQCYLEAEPLFAAGRIELLDHVAQASELRLLERRHRPGGRVPVVDHPKGGHDDHCNALALALAALAPKLAPAVDMGSEPAPSPLELRRRLMELPYAGSGTDVGARMRRAPDEVSAGPVRERFARRGGRFFQRGSW